MSSNDTHAHENAAHSPAPTPKSSFSAAFWLVMLLLGLFIAAINFIDVMSHGEHEKEGAATEEVSTGAASENESSSAATTTHDTTAQHMPMAKDTAKH